MPELELYREDNGEMMTALLRESIEQDATINPESYCQMDLQRLSESDEDCIKFLKQYKSLDRATEMAKQSLKWRHEFGVNEVTYSSIDAKLFTMEAVFALGKDKEGNSNVIVVGKKFKLKELDRDELKRYIVYWCESLVKQCGSKKLNLVLYAAGCGLQNVDLDIFWFLLKTFRDYYGHHGRYFIVYELPWILQAIWGVIKGWLAQEDVERIKFVNKKTVRELVDESHLPEFMGGTASLNKTTNGSRPQRKVSVGG